MTMFADPCKLCCSGGDGYHDGGWNDICYCHIPSIANYPKVGHEIIDTIERMKNGTYNAIEAPVSL